MLKNDSLIVVKIGGTSGVKFSSVCMDAAQQIQGGARLVLVHGGSQAATALGENLGYPPRFVTSPSGFTSRYTDLRTLEIFTMAVNGKLNSQLVEILQKLGVNALGISGLDGRLLAAKRKAAIRIVENGKQKVLRDDYTGKITTVNTPLLTTILDGGYTPVIAPLAISSKGETLNVDADRAAAMLAAALQADVLLLLTAAPGLLSEYPDESSLIPELSLDQLKQAFGFAKRRMKKKILGAQEALRGGTSKVIISDGRIDDPISKALAGMGTWISAD
jgi:acetylglutamate/LysW-gamma-L-alpha-aminoadipate kinase